MIIWIIVLANFIKLVQLNSRSEDKDLQQSTPTIRSDTEAENPDEEKIRVSATADAVDATDPQAAVLQVIDDQ